VNVFIRRFKLPIWLSLLFTVGYLYVKDESNNIIFSCFTIELPWKNNEDKVSCIPAGVYPLVWEFSQHFGRNLWEIKNVPQRDECKLHVANRVSELLGCAGLGDSIAMEAKGWYVTNSRATIENFHRVMAGHTKATITIWQD
jgi:hypothetical protein